MPSTPKNDSNSRKRKIAAISVSSDPNSDKFKLLAIDCEFVGVGPRKLSALGRCSIVDYWGKTVLDIHAIPEDPITDYRTPWSGIKPCHMKHAIPFESARNVVKTVIKNKILIGHAVHNDFKVLRMEHSIPANSVRDTSTYTPLKQMAKLNVVTPSLKALTRALLGRDIQLNEHDSVEDAKATMDLYKKVETRWEAEVAAASKKKSCKRDGSKRTRTSSNNASFLDDEYWVDTTDDETTDVSTEDDEE